MRASYQQSRNILCRWPKCKQIEICVEVVKCCTSYLPTYIHYKSFSNNFLNPIINPSEPRYELRETWDWSEMRLYWLQWWRCFIITNREEVWYAMISLDQIDRSHSFDRYKQKDLQKFQVLQYNRKTNRSVCTILVGWGVKILGRGSKILRQKWVPPLSLYC